MSRFFPQKTVNLDAKDRALVNALCVDAREPVTALARTLRLSREVVSYRLDKLISNGVVRGTCALPNFKHLGFRKYRVLFLLDERQHQTHKTFIAKIIAHPHTRSVIEYTDTWDVGWSLVCRSIDEFNEIVHAVTEPFDNLIIATERLAIITTLTSWMLPRKDRASLPGRIQHDKVLDEVDSKLFTALAHDARTPAIALAKQTGVNAEAVARRIRSLRDSRTMGGFTAVVNASALGYSWYQFAITFGPLSKDDEKQIAEYVSAHPSIARAQRTFGTFDLLLDVLVLSTDEYHRTTKEIKNVFAEKIRRYQSWLVYTEHVFVALPSAILAQKVLPAPSQKKNKKR